MARRLDYAQADFADRFADLLASKRESDLDVSAAVADILADVRQHGDEALLQLTAKFDRLQCERVVDLAIGQDEMNAALANLDPALRDALQVAATKKLACPQHHAHPGGVCAARRPFFAGACCGGCATACCTRRPGQLVELAGY